ncbi:MAG: squalene/phytoene synthase family protein, partial [Bacteriovoracaceae bacterium]|nr:squalene/phytoene synthase family protein [Bacteriovoracaceae bacterium]
MNRPTYNALIENYLKADPVNLMARHGKSFYFASLIFSKERLNKIATLYKLCRFIDDCADELSLDESKYAINKIISELDNRKDESELNSLISQVQSFGVERGHLKELVSGAQFDAQKGPILNESDLMLYCYRVAGVVGLMMCPLIGVRDLRANPHAIDLGLGMQLTNICRDVLEDAQNGRVYLPEDRV